MSMERVADILRQVTSGELTHDQIEIVRTFLEQGIDILALT